MIICIALLPLEYLGDPHLDLVTEQLEPGTDFLLWLWLLLDYFLFNLFFLLVFRFFVLDLVILCIALLPLENLGDPHLDLVSEQLDSRTDFLFCLWLFLDYFLFNLFFLSMMLGLSTSHLSEDALDFAEDVLSLDLDVLKVLFSVHEELFHCALR